MSHHYEMIRAAIEKLARMPEEHRMGILKEQRRRWIIGEMKMGDPSVSQEQAENAYEELGIP